MLIETKATAKLVDVGMKHLTGATQNTNTLQEAELNLSRAARILRSRDGNDRDDEQLLRAYTGLMRVQLVRTSSSKISQPARRLMLENAIEFQNSALEVARRKQNNAGDLGKLQLWRGVIRGREAELDAKEAGNDSPVVRDKKARAVEEIVSAMQALRSAGESDAVAWGQEWLRRLM